MLVYGYDGSFEGILTAVFDAFDRRERPDMVHTQHNLQLGFEDVYHEVVTDSEKTDRVQTGIVQKIGREALETVYSAYLTPHVDKATLIYQYLRMGFKLGAAVADRFDDPIVMKMVHYNRQVGGEAHLLKGFVRFRGVEGSYYGVIAPTNDVLAMLAPHFAARFNDQRWMLQDEKRGKAVLSVGGEWVMVEDPSIAPPPPGEEELRYRALWRAFHHTLAIESRRNPKLQRQMLPKKFWKHMTEMNGLAPDVLDALGIQMESINPGTPQLAAPERQAVAAMVERLALPDPDA